MATDEAAAPTDALTAALRTIGEHGYAVLIPAPGEWHGTPYVSLTTDPNTPGWISVRGDTLEAAVAAAAAHVTALAETRKQQ